MEWIGKIFSSKSKAPKTGNEPEYDHYALFGEKAPEGSNPVSGVEVDGVVEVDPVSKSELEQKVELEPTSNFELENDPETGFLKQRFTHEKIDAAVSCILEIGKPKLEAEDGFSRIIPEAEVDASIAAFKGCDDEDRLRAEYERVLAIIRANALSPHHEAELIWNLADGLKIKVVGLEMVGMADPAGAGDEFPEVENSAEVEVDPSGGFEKEPFISNEVEASLENEISENPNSLDRWQRMGDALNDGNIEVDDRPFDSAEFEPEASRFGSAIRWTDGLANPILWTIENDWTKRELSTIKDFVGKLAVAVRNRGVLLDSDNIKVMAETISAENVGRTMYLLSEPWMSRTKLNSFDAMILAGKLAPKICNSLKFETLLKAGLSEAFAKTQAEFEAKLGSASRSDLQHVVQVLRSFKTPLAYTMASSLDYVCACLGDRAAMVRISDAIQTLLGDDMIEPENVLLDMAHVADNWHRLAHAQYFGSDNSFEAFEQRLSIETLDLTGKTGNVEFDSRVVLPDPSVDLMELCAQLNVARRIRPGHHEPVDPKSPLSDDAIKVITEVVSTTPNELSASEQEFFDQIAKGYSDSIGVPLSTEADVIVTNPMDDSIRIRVLDRIAGSDGNSSAERNYGHLLRPLPILPAPDPDTLYSALMTEFPWMAEINEEVARAAALGSRHIGECFTIPPMLLNGPSGVGKTRWVRRVAQLSSIPMHFISVAGSDSSKAIMGSERGWSNARPSLPVLALSSTQIVNPIIMVDELDKANASSNGDPFAALLPMLAKETNSTYPDAYLLGSVNVSYASFIFTANSISKLGTPLLDRLDVFNVSRPSVKDYPVIMRGMVMDAAQEALLDIADAEALMDKMTDLGMDCLSRGDSLRKVERAISDAVAKHIWKPKTHLTVVK